MKKIFIIFLFVIFSSSLSLAKNNEKITVEEIENIFFGNQKKWPLINEGLSKEESKKRYERLMRWEKGNKKRLRFKNIAKCMYDKETGGEKTAAAPGDVELICRSKIIRVVLSRSEKNKKLRPGDIFYTLSAIDGVVTNFRKKYKFIENHHHYKDEKPIPGMVCTKGKKMFFCSAFRKSTYKKIEKFKKDTSNEKALGKELNKYIKNIRMVNGIRKKLGINNTIYDAERGHISYDTKIVYNLLGDMLNASVVEVKKNNISPDLQKRRDLLKKYSLILKGIKKKLKEDKYKSIEKDVSKLSKTFKDLNALTTTNEMAINIDEAVNIIFDTNKLIQKSVLNAKDNKEEKLLALSSIYFMQSLIDSILSTIPEKYYVETKELSRDLFNDDDLEELDAIINTMIKKNKEIKSAELTKSTDIINKYINSSDVLKTLDNLGMKNSINREFTQNTVSGIVDQHLRDNLDKEVLKEAKKLLKEIDTKEFSDLTKEISDVSKEVSDVAKEVSGASNTPKYDSVLDHKFGGVPLKALIHRSR